MADEPEYPSWLNDKGLTVVLDGVMHSFPKYHPNYNVALVAHKKHDKETLFSLSELGKGLCGGVNRTFTAHKGTGLGDEDLMLVMIKRKKRRNKNINNQ